MLTQQPARDVVVTTDEAVLTSVDEVLRELLHNADDASHGEVPDEVEQRGNLAENFEDDRRELPAFDVAVRVAVVHQVLDMIVSTLGRELKLKTNQGSSAAVGDIAHDVVRPVLDRVREVDGAVGNALAAPLDARKQVPNTLLDEDLPSRNTTSRTISQWVFYLRQGE